MNILRIGIRALLCLLFFASFTICYADEGVENPADTGQIHLQSLPHSLSSIRTIAVSDGGEGGEGEAAPAPEKKGVVQELEYDRGTIEITPIIAGTFYSREMRLTRQTSMGLRITLNFFDGMFGLEGSVMYQNPVLRYHHLSHSGNVIYSNVNVVARCPKLLLDAIQPYVSAGAGGFAFWNFKNFDDTGAYSFNYAIGFDLWFERDAYLKFEFRHMLLTTDFGPWDHGVSNAFELAAGFSVGF
jgi:hypothetical protein